jgi:hypothetical protein
LSDDVQHWLARHDIERAGPILTVHERPWSTVLRVPVADGDLFLEQEQPVQAYEVPLTAALYERWPDRVPEVVVADTETAWLLLRDAGVSVALELYGELQVAERQRVDDFLEIGGSPFSPTA